MMRLAVGKQGQHTALNWTPPAFFAPLPGSQLAFRAVAVKERRLDDELIGRRLERSVSLRQRLFEGRDTDGEGVGSACMRCVGPGAAAGASSLLLLLQRQQVVH